MNKNEIKKEGDAEQIPEKEGYEHSYAADVGETGDTQLSPFKGDPDAENGEFEKAYKRSKAQSDEQGRPMTDDDYRSGRGQGTWDEGKFGKLEVGQEPWEEGRPEEFRKSAPVGDSDKKSGRAEE
jgi:hypothetical protein